MIICRNHRPPYPQFENDMVVAACSVRHSGAACVAAARRVPARAGRVPRVRLSRDACVPAAGRVPGWAVDWLRLVYGNA